MKEFDCSVRRGGRPLRRPREAEPWEMERKKRSRKERWYDDLASGTNATRKAELIERKIFLS